MNSKKKPLITSQSHTVLGVTQGPAAFSTNESATKQAIPTLPGNSAQKSMLDSFYTQKGAGMVLVESKKKKKNFGITLSKLELPPRLVQQKELFNEMKGWLSSASQQKLVSLSQQNTRRSFHSKLLSSQSNYFQTTQSQTMSLVNIEPFGNERKKPNFYEHKNIFRVKDFRQLKNKEEKIAQSVDDPITIAQRRLLIQEFEMKVQQFLKILKIKKELGVKSYERYYKTVEQSMGGLNSLTFQGHHTRGNSLFTQQNNNISITNQNQVLPNNTSIQEGQNQFAPITLNQNGQPKNQLNFANYPQQADSVLSTMAAQKRTFRTHQPSLQMNSEQQQQLATQGEANSSHNSLNTLQENSNNSGYKQASFVDRNKDIEWQYNTYYQINQHQFQELSDKQISFLTPDEKEQYYTVLNYFKQVGHRFQVQVVVQHATTNDTQDEIQENTQQGSFLPTIQSKQQQRRQNNTQTSHSNSRLAIHQRLQDYILERCRNYLNSDNTNYDEKLKMMKKQYEQMLDNFNHLSHRVWLPANIKPRGQDFNDFYVYEEPEDLNSLLKKTFEDLTEENFGSVLSINMNMVNDPSFQDIKDIAPIKIEDNVEQEEKMEEEEPEEENDENNDFTEESSYVETPYSQKKARNKKKFENSRAAASQFNQREEEQPAPPQIKPPKKKKKKPQEIVIDPATNRSGMNSARSEQSEDSDSNFSRAYSNKFQSGAFRSNEGSPLPKPKQSKYGKKAQSPQSNRSSLQNDSETEDKVDNQTPRKVQQPRSQFAKKVAQPTSKTVSRRTIEGTSEQNTDNSALQVNQTLEKLDTDREIKTPLSIEILQMSPKETKKKIVRKNDNEDDDGFEQAQDDLEDMNDNQQQGGNNNPNFNRNGFNNLDLNFDMSDKDQNTSRKKIGGQQDNLTPSQKKNINQQAGAAQGSSTPTQPGSNRNIPQSQKLVKERSQSNGSAKSSQSIPGQGANKQQAAAGSTFKQKIQNEIMMEEEQKRKENEQEFETVVIGTGLFDRILACSNYLDFDINSYQKSKPKPAVTQNIQFSKEADKLVFQKISQWEQEVSEENESYSRTQDTTIEQLLRVQNSINEKRNKAKNISESSSNVSSKKQIKVTNEASQSNYKSQTSIQNKLQEDSIIESSQFDGLGSSYLQDTSFFGNNKNYTTQQNKQTGSNRSVSQPHEMKRQKSNYSREGMSDKESPLNKSIQEKASPLSTSGKGFHLNLSKLNSSKNEQSSPQPTIKKKFKTNPSDSARGQNNNENSIQIKTDSDKSREESISSNINSDKENKDSAQ